MIEKRNGHHHDPRKRKRQGLKDDEFSRDLAAQGEEGRFMRMLYLNQEMYSYQKRIMDEPLQY